MPITSWAYKTEKETRHIGPVAQDFHAAFAIGSDDRTISTVDEGGVALAAIQGLNFKIEEQSAAIAERDRMLTAMRTEIAELREEMAHVVRAIAH